MALHCPEKEFLKQQLSFRIGDRKSVHDLARDGQILPLSEDAMTRKAETLPDTKYKSLIERTRAFMKSIKRMADNLLGSAVKSPPAAPATGNMAMGSSRRKSNWKSKSRTHWRCWKKNVEMPSVLKESTGNCIPRKNFLHTKKQCWQLRRWKNEENSGKPSRPQHLNRKRKRFLPSRSPRNGKPFRLPRSAPDQFGTMYRHPSY